MKMLLDTNKKGSPSREAKEGVFPPTKKSAPNLIFHDVTWIILSGMGRFSLQWRSLDVRNGMARPLTVSEDSSRAASSISCAATFFRPLSIRTNIVCGINYFSASPAFRVFTSAIKHLFQPVPSGARVS